MMEKINKFIISRRFLLYTPFWYWYRLISHTGLRLDDYILHENFWRSLNKYDALYCEKEYQW
jgi:hypothetical protein